MQTQVLSGDDLSPAIALLKEGHPVVFPTETVYGLGAPIFNLDAVKKIFSIKGRPSDNPLIVHVASMEQAVSLAQNLPKEFFLLADHFWPGPLTMIVQRNPEVPGPLPSIALRMPSHPIAKKLIEEVGPLAAPSANLSGRPSPTSVGDVLEDLFGRVALVIDGGESLLGIESTVISLLDESIVLLRPGVITEEILVSVLGKPLRRPKKGEEVLSPGMKYRHYAPRASLRLLYKKEDFTGMYVLSPHHIPGTRLLTEKTLYAELRRADRRGIEEIGIDCTHRLPDALMDRISRALQ